jgi:DNA-binding NarL/FixJ family response regulator
MTPPIRILIVDDQSLFRAGLHTLLDVQPEFEVVGEAENGEEALRLAVQLQPAVVLMDLRMPVMNGAAATRRLHELLPDCHVLVLTTFDDDEDVFEGLRAGAVGYLLKDASSDKLFEAIRSAAQGEYFLQPSITSKVMAEFARLSREARRQPEGLLEPLSEREMDILRLLAQGLSNRVIAGQLVIAEGTVKNHVTSILAKMDAKDRLQAVLKAKSLGLL